MSGSQKSSSRFALSDIDSMAAGDTPIKKVSTESSKPRVPHLRSKAGSRKRKNTDVIEIDDGPLLLDHDQAVKHGQMILEQLSRNFEEKVSEIEDMKKIAAAKTDMINEYAAKITKLEGEIEAQAKSHESFLKEFIEKHAQEMDELVAEAKRSAGAVIFEARIRMAEEAKEKGVDISFWDVESWQKAKAKFEDPENKDEEAYKGEGYMVLDEGRETTEPVVE